MAQVLRVSTGLPVGEFSDLHIGAEVHLPTGKDRGIALVCLAGGGMRRQFYDLPVPGDRSFSFTQAMCQLGFTCVLLDHPGIGDSDQPENGYLLNQDLIAEAHHRALHVLRGQMPALADKPTLGVGHSMGAMISLIQQANNQTHAGLILLGFGFDGLPQYLHPKVKAMLDDRASIDAQAADLARKTFRVSYPIMQGGGGRIYGGETADRAGVEGIKAVATHMLPVPAFMSMLPHHWDGHAAKVQVPVLIALGDNDLVKAPDNPDQIFSSGCDVDVMVLPETGHSTFLFASRTALFERIDRWVADAGI